jgi:hypothetical protein
MKKIAKFANDWQGASRKFETLAQLASAKTLSQAEKDSVLFGLMALQFALQPDLVERFNRYLLEFPRVLTPEQEAHLDELESEQ